MKDKIEEILKLDNHFRTVNSFVDDEGINHLPLIKKELLDLFESELRILKEEAKAEERQRCLEALPKKKHTCRHDDPSPTCCPARIFDEGFNDCIDQAISAISNQTKDL